MCTLVDGAQIAVHSGWGLSRCCGISKRHDRTSLSVQWWCDWWSSNQRWCCQHLWSSCVYWCQLQVWSNHRFKSPPMLLVVINFLNIKIIDQLSRCVITFDCFGVILIELCPVGGGESRREPCGRVKYTWEHLLHSKHVCPIVLQQFYPNRYVAIV